MSNNHDDQDIDLKEVTDDIFEGFGLKFSSPQQLLKFMGIQDILDDEYKKEEPKQKQLSMNNFNKSQVLSKQMDDDDDDIDYEMDDNQQKNTGKQSNYDNGDLLSVSRDHKRRHLDSMNFEGQDNRDDYDEYQERCEDDEEIYAKQHYTAQDIHDPVQTRIEQKKQVFVGNSDDMFDFQGRKYLRWINYNGQRDNMVLSLSDFYIPASFQIRNIYKKKLEQYIWRPRRIDSERYAEIALQIQEILSNQKTQDHLFSAVDEDPEDKNPTQLEKRKKQNPNYCVDKITQRRLLEIVKENEDSKDNYFIHIQKEQQNFRFEKLEANCNYSALSSFEFYVDLFQQITTNLADDSFALKKLVPIDVEEKHDQIESQRNIGGTKSTQKKKKKQIQSDHHRRQIDSDEDSFTERRQQKGVNYSFGKDIKIFTDQVLGHLNKHYETADIIKIKDDNEFVQNLNHKLFVTQTANENYETGQKFSMQIEDRGKKKQDFKQYWGEVKDLRFERKFHSFHDNQRLFYLKNQHHSVQDQMDPTQFEENISELEKKITFQNERIINSFDYYNRELLEDGWLKDQKELNRVEIDLNDQQMFIPAVSHIFNFSEKMRREALKKTMKIPVVGENQTLIKQDEQQSKIDELKSIPSSHITDLQLPKTHPIIMPIIHEKKDLVQELIQITRENQINRKDRFTHSQLAFDFVFNNFKMDPQQHPRYHRYDILNFIKRNEKWEISVLKSTSKTSLEIKRHKKNLKAAQKSGNQNVADLEDNFEVSNEYIQGYMKFQDFSSLSCTNKDYPFILMEYIQENPLILQNVGMNSKLNRYVYDKKVIEKLELLEKMDQWRSTTDGSDKNDVESESDLRKFKNFINETLGQLGSVCFQNEKDNNIPLLAQTYHLENVYGITTIENQLFVAPVFKQKLPETDFILARRRNADGTYTNTLRQIDYIYIVGQIEPQKEIFSPGSRPYSSFSKNCIQTQIKMDFRKNEKIDITELVNIFKQIQLIKKELGSLKFEPSTDRREQNIYYQQNLHLFTTDTSKPQQQQIDMENYDITPEDACLYERMLNCQYRLLEFGLNDLKLPDKLKTAINRLIKEDFNDITPYAVAQLILQELNLTCWNLSLNFINRKNSKFFLEGPSDPTNGHGGYCFIKKPLKQRIDRDFRPNDDRRRSITGTNQDLRKLSIQQCGTILLRLGVTEEELKTKYPRRWGRITKIKELCSNTDNDFSNLSDIIEIQDILNLYKRQDRQTTAQQREKYHTQINEIFAIMIQNISTMQEAQIIQEEQNQYRKERNINYYIERERENWQQKQERCRVNDNPDERDNADSSDMDSESDD